ncbi:hypothetical protein CcCBS67573_g04921 [Chytriomyces confervae]|uniref:Tim44-like domain-containing protein n=1 Tax=Chytriomyces confervae TaxID=246404 RepID=A0A507FBU8_9FUNG|nr:hypothetical protein CcCBS67573_g04921 [Chytriomyces confervae]
MKSFWLIAARCQSTWATTPAANAATVDLLAQYPVRISASNPQRRGYFEQFTNSPLYERLLMMPFRLKLAEMAGKGFLNSRFEDDSGREFYPRQFQKGVQRAIPSLFNLLSGWDGISDEKRLKTVLSSHLYAEFSKQHQRIHAQGYSILFNWRYLNFRWTHEKPDESPIRPQNVWITFGNPRNATSTLLTGPVTMRNHSTVFTRRVEADVVGVEGGAKKPVMKQRRVFREICFEYVYTPSDFQADEGMEVGEDGQVVDGLLSFETKREMMDMGQKVAVDSKVAGGVLDYVIVRNSDGATMSSGEVDLDGMGVRLETTYFTDEFPDDGRWKVADIDNYLTYPRVLEEEMDPDASSS